MQHSHRRRSVLVQRLEPVPSCHTATLSILTSAPKGENAMSLFRHPSRSVRRTSLMLASATAALAGLSLAAHAAPLPGGIYVERVGGTAAFGAGTGIADNTTALPV